MTQHKRILLLGYRPPPLMGDAKIEAAHYRTWQFVEPLVADGHEVLLCAGTRDEAVPAKHAGMALTQTPQTGRMGFTPIRFGASGSHWLQTLQQAHDSFCPDCVIAVNFSHCVYATRLHTHKPMWMDIYGDMLTIQQAGMYRAHSNRGLHTTLAFMRDVLHKGDVFSGCSEPQKHMLVGELAMMGRLDRSTFGYEFVQVIPPGAPLSSATQDAPATASPEKQPHLCLRPRPRPRPLLTQLGVALPQDAFVVLWCGGYNTWTDTKLLFEALELAMAQSAYIHFVSVGANTYDVPDNVYAQLLQRIAQSPHRARFHMLGWRPWAEMAQFFDESDAGINLDALHYETIYGTRTRLVEMMAAGLPVVTSEGTELIKHITQHQAGLVFASGDALGFGNCLLRLAADTALHGHLAQCALRFATERLAFEVTLAPVRRWVLHPQRAPDHRRMEVDSAIKRVEFRLRSFLRRVDWLARGADR